MLAIHGSDRGGESFLDLRVICDFPSFNNAAKPPTITSIPPTNVFLGDTLHYTVTAQSNNPVDTLVYKLIESPLGMTIDSVTGKILWVPSEQQAGVHGTIVEVKNIYGYKDVQSFNDTVSLFVNVPPMITSTPRTSGKVGGSYAYTVAATDGNNDRLIYSLPIAPAGMTINSLTGMIGWIPSPANLGTNAVELLVSDPHGASDSQTFSIVIIDSVNLPPHISSTPPSAGIEDGLYAYQVEAQDGNAEDILQFSLIQSPAQMTINSSTGLVQWTPGSGDIGTHDPVHRLHRGRG